MYRINGVQSNNLVQILRLLTDAGEKAGLQHEYGTQYYASAQTLTIIPPI